MLLVGAALFAGLFTTGRSAASTRTLTFEERVEAQRVIERVYYSHLTEARRPFEQAVTPALLERKVRAYLKQSAALEQHWQTPITAEMLRAETERITRNTRFPERLIEIDAALGHDDFLVQETLVRAALADRLSHNFQISDERIHVAARAEAELIHQQLVDGVIDLNLTHPRRTVLEAVALTNEAAPPPLTPSPALATAGSARMLRVDVSMEELRQLRKSAPATPGEIGPVLDEPGAFVIRVLLSSEPGIARIASYTVPKILWQTWWETHQNGFDESAVAAVAVGGGSTLQALAARNAAQTCAQDDVWDNGSLDDVPDARSRHAAVWTGNEMIIWGGENAANGGRYDPLLDTWRGMSYHGAPAQGFLSTAVWTGTVMIVWGISNDPPIAAGRYDPILDQWSSVSTVNAPTRRLRHSAVWTGREMIIWGGQIDGVVTATGARYDPVADAWLPITMTDAPSPRLFHTAIWTDQEMIVWGGRRTFSFSSSPGDYLGTGAKYNPGTDTWSPVGTVNAPSARADHTAVWTGGEMIVWGGLAPPFFSQEGGTSSGGRYDPVADTWTPTSQLNVPSRRRAQTAVWTGTRMIVWGGSRYSMSAAFPPDTSGGLYDPSTDTWRPTSLLNAPIGRSSHSVVWTGSQMIVWGGEWGNGTSLAQQLSNGGRYDPSSDSWTPTSRSRQGVFVSGLSPIVWTGTEMLAWSLSSAGGVPASAGGGGRYDPMLDTWRAISTVGAPTARYSHVAVWTGDEMIVWGGQVSFVALGDGGKYDPIADAWLPISSVNAPVRREGARAVWSGREMILWGGYQGCSGSPVCLPAGLGTGARYDPASDTWRALSLLNAPSPVVNHTMVWTGREVIVWGGYQFSCGSGGGCPSVYSDRGARYDPELDAWFPLPPLPAGQRRYGHAAVWTGREMMIVGGGGDSPQQFVLAWLYDRAADAWSPVPSDPLQPSNLFGSTAAWTGRHVLVFGFVNQFLSTDSGRTFDRATEGWSRMSTVNAPLARGGHGAVWTGSTMLIWGGLFGQNSLESGGRYSFGQNSDDDGDGFTRCAGDCDDTSATIHPGAAETCNGRDDDCDGLVDEDAAGHDTDSDGVANACDACPTFPNPGQSSHLACISAEPGDGQCLPARILLPEPISQGAVTLVRERPGPPDSIHFVLNLTSCDQIDPLEFRLNGQTIASFLEPQESCTCVPPPYHVTVSDAALLASTWRATGDNIFEIHQTRAPGPPGSLPGTFVAWVRARLESSNGQLPETICLFDANGGACDEPDQCRGGVSENALDVSLVVPADLLVEESLSSTPFTAGRLPPTIDIGTVPDGPMKLCVGPEGPPRFYAATTNGSLHLVDPATGATSPAGVLPFALLEVAHDDLTRRMFLQTTQPGSERVVEIDPVGAKILADSPIRGLPLNGMEFVNGRLYGVDSKLGGVRFLEISPDTGYSRVVVDLPVGIWDGLTYDRAAGVFYTWRTFGIASALWSIDAIIGKAHELHTLSFEPSALEFGPDGSLYASRSIGSDTELYRLDTATGDATLVGRMGVAGVVSLATVRNLPRACLDIVKQSEQTLATGGSCGGGPPTANAGPDRSVECASPAGSFVTLDGSLSSDPDSTPGTLDDIVLFEWFEEFGTPAARLLGSGVTLELQLPLEVHHITLKVTDRAGGSSTDETVIRIEDTTGPALDVNLSPATLWPPNHRMIPAAAAATATDVCGASSVQLISVTSSEPDDQAGPGDGKTENDIQSATPGTADFDFDLRAERDGAGTGRIYTVVYRATDSAGNSTERTSAVVVPHDQAGIIEPVDITLSETGRGTVVTWNPVPGALSYSVIRGRLSEVRDILTEINLGAVACIEAGSVDSSTAGREDATLPSVGEAFFYLAEYSDGGASSYSEPSAAKPRTVGSGGCR